MVQKKRKKSLHYVIPNLHPTHPSILGFHFLPEMAQKKLPDKSTSQLQPKKNQVKSDKSLSSHQHQDIRNKGGSDLKKKMKKVRSIKISDVKGLGGCQDTQFNKPSPQKKPSLVKVSDGSPNYMKPTSNSNAKKDRLQVSIQSPTTADKNQSPKNSNNSNHLKPSASGPKPAKVLARKTSLKLVRPLMKKSSGIPSFPKINASRATCACNMKNSKFPNALELNPGGTELEGTSVMKICPYTYCSLNGHRHEPLPPLKCFLSARRRLLKTQKSMKLKGLSPFRKRDSQKGKKEIDTGHMVLSRVPSSVPGVSPLIEEVGNDFFVEIYAKLQAESTESVNDEENSIREGGGAVNPEALTEVSLLGDIKKGAETEIENGRGDIRSLMDESCSEISSEDNLDKNSHLSASEMDLLVTAIEYVECDYQVEPRNREKPPCLAQDYVEWNFECCIPSDSVKTSNGLADNRSNGTVFEVTDMNWDEGRTPCPGDSTDYSEIPDNGFHPSLASLPRDEDTDGELSLEQGNNVSTCEEASLDVVAIQEPNDESKNLEVDCMAKASTLTNSLIQNQLTDCSDHNTKSLQSSEGYDQGWVLEIEGNDNPSGINNIMDTKDHTVEEPTQASDPESKILLGGSLLGEDNNEDVGGVFSHQVSETVDLETAENMATSKESQDNALLGNDIEGKNQKDDAKCANRSLEIQFWAYHQDLSETEDDVKIETGLQVCLYDDATKDPSLPSEIHSCSTDGQSDHGNTEENPEKSEDNPCKESIETETTKSKLTKEDDTEMVYIMQIEDDAEPGEDETCPAAGCKCPEEDKAITSAARNTNQLLSETSSNLKTRANVQRNRANEDLEELKPFNPHPPCFLPIEPDPETEKVDLRHLMMDERKNSEEWMIDYALQQAVNKLAPARKRKVALLVEAFESVKPLPMCDKPLRHATMEFGHPRPVQACS